MTVIVRPARSADFPAIRAIGLELQDLHATGRPDVFRPGVEPLPQEYFAAHLDADPPTVFVAQQDEAGNAQGEGAVIGYVLLSVHRSPLYDMMHRRVVASVEQIGVLEAERGRGAGRALMEFAQRWAREQHADVLRLHVWEFNADAIAFYERVGMATESQMMEYKVTSDE